MLVDDHAILREGLRLLIDSQADRACVGEASLVLENGSVLARNNIGSEN